MGYNYLLMYILIRLYPEFRYIRIYITFITVATESC